MQTSNQGFILKPLRTIEIQYHGTNIPEIDSLFLSQFENNCHKWSVWFNRFIHLTEKITQDIILVIIFYSLMTIISLFPWYDIFISHFICIYTLSLLLLARELFAHFVCNYMRLHSHSEQNDSLCLPHNLSSGLSILRHSLFMAPIRNTLEWQTPTICLIKFFFIQLDMIN